MAAAFVQAAQNGNNVSGASIATGSITTTTGNAIFAAVSYDNGLVPVASMTDPNGNAMTEVGTGFVDSNSNMHRHFFRLNVTGATGAVTLSFDSGATFRNVVAHEVSGILTAAALDQNSGGSEETGTAVTDTAVVTTTNGQYIFASCYVGGGTASNTIAPGSGFIEPATNSTSNAANNELMTEYQIQGAAGSITAAFTRSGSGLCNMRTSTFKATAAGPTDHSGAATFSGAGSFSAQATQVTPVTLMGQIVMKAAA